MHYAWGFSRLLSFTKGRPGRTRKTSASGKTHSAGSPIERRDC